MSPDELDEVCSAINEMRESLRQELDERQRSEMASAFLARVGEVLLESLDLEVMLPRIASLYGELRRVGGAHVDAAKLPCWTSSSAATHPARTRGPRWPRSWVGGTRAGWSRW